MLVPKDSLIIAVDGTRMSVFRNVGEAFAPVLKLIGEQKISSLKSSELGSDRPGRSFKSMTPRRGAHESTDLQQQEEDRFNIEASKHIDWLAADAQSGAVLVAAPRALGVIRKHLKPETSARLLAEIPKAFGPDDAEKLAKMLAKHEA